MKLIPKHQLGKKIYDDEIIRLNLFDPNIRERSPFYNRVEDTYGTVELPEIEISTPWTPEGLRNSAARKGKLYMYDALQQGYNVVGPLLSTLVSAPMDFGVANQIGEGIKELTKNLKWIYNKGNIIQKTLKTNPNNYYRTVNKDAIIDAKQTRIIKGPEQSKGPFFAKGINISDTNGKHH